MEGRWPVMPMVGGFFVLVFGGLTIWLQDETFIKLKPTIVNCLFGVILGGGLLLLKRPLLKPIFGAAFQLTDEGWRKLTVRWALFFFVLAAINEVRLAQLLDRHLDRQQDVRELPGDPGLRLLPDPAAQAPLGRRRQPVRVIGSERSVSAGNDAASERIAVRRSAMLHAPVTKRPGIALESKTA